MKERLEALLDFYKETSNSIAIKLGTSQTSVSSYIKKGTKPGYDFLHSLLLAFPDVSAEWLMRGEGKMSLVEREADRLAELAKSATSAHIVGRDQINSPENSTIYTSSPDLLKELEDLKAENTKLRERNDKLFEQNLALTNKLLAL